MHPQLVPVAPMVQPPGQPWKCGSVFRRFQIMRYHKIKINCGRRDVIFCQNVRRPVRAQKNVLEIVRLREDQEHLCADGGGAVAGFDEG